MKRLMQVVGAFIVLFGVFSLGAWQEARLTGGYIFVGNRAVGAAVDSTFWFPSDATGGIDLLKTSTGAIAVRAISWSTDAVCTLMVYSAQAPGDSTCVVIDAPSGVGNNGSFPVVHGGYSKIRLAGAGTAGTINIMAVL